MKVPASFQLLGSSRSTSLVVTCGLSRGGVRRTAAGIQEAERVDRSAVLKTNDNLISEKSWVIVEARRKFRDETP